MRIFILLMFSGQPHTGTVWNIPQSFGPDSFVEPAVKVHMRSSHLLHGKFLDLFRARGACFLKPIARTCLWTLMVWSLVATLLTAERPLLPPFSVGAIVRRLVGKEGCEVLWERGSLVHPRNKNGIGLLAQKGACFSLCLTLPCLCSLFLSAWGRISTAGLHGCGIRLESGGGPPCPLGRRPWDSIPDVVWEGGRLLGGSGGLPCIS